MFFEGNNRIYIAGNAWILDEKVGVGNPMIEVATSEWAGKHIIPNEANSYIVGRFVEADKANHNQQYFRLGDLLMAQPTISYAPLNVNHQSAPVGTFISSEMQYPVNEGGNPYIEALAAFWKHIFPDTYAQVQTAFASGGLFYSMEAVPETLSTIGGSNDEAQYAYAGRKSDTYPDEINSRSCPVVLNNPHFVGGALIIPPAKPGWSGADVKQVSQLIKDRWETAEQIHEGVKTMAPQLDSQAQEALMNEMLQMVVEEGKKLTTQARNKLPTSAFAIPGTRSYPIHDINHARNALARVAQFGTPEEKSKVRAAVMKRYPQLKKAA